MLSAKYSVLGPLFFPPFSLTMTVPRMRTRLLLSSSFSPRRVIANGRQIWGSITSTYLLNLQLSCLAKDGKKESSGQGLYLGTKAPFGNRTNSGKKLVWIIEEHHSSWVWFSSADTKFLTATTRSRVLENKNNNIHLSS